MSMFQHIKIHFQRKAKLINLMRDFLEGRMSVFEFWEVYKENYELRQLLISDSLKNRKFTTYYDPEYLIQRVNLNKLRDRLEVFWVVKRYFKTNRISSIPMNEDEENFIFLTSIQPDWLDINVESLIELLNSAPEDLEMQEKADWCKMRINEKFIYDDKPPMWLQNPEWPIVNGKPLVFRYQTSEIEDFSITKIKYFFYNPETSEEVTIEQYD